MMKKHPFPGDVLISMNQSRWLKERHQVGVMLAALEEADASKRKLWLFVCACYRRIWPFLDEFHRKYAEVVERLAEGKATRRELKKAGIEADEDFASVCYGARESWAPAANIVADAFPEVILDLVHTENVIYLAEIAAQCDSVRDIFGNPYRPVTLDSAWLTPTVVSFARTIYEQRAFQYMPLLACALEREGCNQAAVLKHCRQLPEHVRGCWLVDLILGKQ